LDVDLITQLPNLIASRKQRVIGRIMTEVKKVRVNSETNLREILDKVHEIHIDHIDDTHFFTLSQVYEEMRKKGCIYTNVVAPSPAGEGWDEGKCKWLILISSPQPSPVGEGARSLCK
jgi:hypothetical protein